MMHDYHGALEDCLQLDSLTAYVKPGVWGEDLDMVVGLCYLKLGDYQNARLRFTNSITRVTEATGKEWNTPRVFLYLGIARMMEMEYSQAIHHFNELIQLYPNYSEGYYYKAESFKAMGDLKNAEATLERCEQVFDRFGAEKNPYFEMPFQLYPSMLYNF